MRTEKLPLMLAGACIAAVFSGAAHALNLGVFGDLGIIKQEGRDAQFRLGQVDFFIQEDIDDKTRAFAELELQIGSGSSSSEFEVQRFWIMRDFTDGFSLGAGRFHTPIGYWSRQFHHGKLMKPTVTRPFILGFEGSRAAFIPMHMVGLMAEGEIGEGYRYELGVANSNAINSSTPGNSGRTLLVGNRSDNSPDKSVFARFSYDVLRVPFKPGISFMWNDVNEAASGNNSEFDGFVAGDALVRQALVGFDLRYEYRRFDFLAESYWLQNDSQPGVGDGGKYDATAWFAQFSYRLNERVQLTYRHESMNFDDRDPYFTHPRLLGRTSGGNESRNVYALRYDFHESNAVKLEVSERPQFTGGTERVHFINWEFVIF